MNLELQKRKLDLQKLETSKLEFEYKVLERLADIDRIKLSIQKQEDAISKVKQEIKKMESK